MSAHRIGGLVVGTLFSGSILSCGGASAIAVPPEYAPKDQTKCSIAATSAKPLIVEWPSADRLELESRVRAGTVVVAYSGCEMRLLTHCRAPGAYTYVAGTPKTDSIAIRDADELYATMPAGAARFEGRLQKSGQLNVAMTLVGRYESQKASVSNLELSGDCRDATHVVSALTVGAFEFFAGADASVRAGAEFVVAEVGGVSSQRRESLVKDGDPQACVSDAAAETAPPRGCSALIRLDVAPVRMEQPAPPPVPIAPPGAAPPPAARAPAAAPPPATQPAPSSSDTSPESTDGNGPLPDPLGFHAAVMVGALPNLRLAGTGSCEQPERPLDDDGVAVGGLAGAHWNLSPDVSITGSGEISIQSEEHVAYGGSLGSGYRLIGGSLANLVVTGGVGIQSIGFKSPTLECNVGLDRGEAHADGRVTIGFIETSVQGHFGDPAHVSSWFAAALRGGIGIYAPERGADTTDGSARVESPPGVSFFGLLGWNF